jgi:hypothetical protein
MRRLRFTRRRVAEALRRGNKEIPVNATGASHCSEAAVPSFAGKPSIDASFVMHCGVCLRHLMILAADVLLRFRCKDRRFTGHEREPSTRLARASPSEPGQRKAGRQVAGLRNHQKVVIAELEVVENSFLWRVDAAHHSSYLDPVRFAEPDNLADDGIGVVCRCGSTLLLLVTCDA